jgi:prepilin-type N-terminal cleavage/methylation domain-containing protein
MGGAAYATSGGLPTCDDRGTPNNDAVQLKSIEARPRKPAAAQAGFTLIELMIVVTVVSLLALIGYPMFVDQVRKSRRAAAGAQAADSRCTSLVMTMDAGNLSYGSTGSATAAQCWNR